MKIEIWSDVVCPFCYIGKRKLEKALDKFPQKDKIEIEWKSFQLNPDQETNPNLSTLEHLSQSKGWSMEQTREITSNVVNMAAAQGLDFDFDKAVVANTKNAHRLIHMAKAIGKGGEMKERLLQAYFSEGKNVDDFATLMSLGEELGLGEADVAEMLESERFEDAVDQDIYESRQLGVRGVPFFVLDRKFGISGAQADEVFDQTLEKAWADYAKENPVLKMAGTEDGESCDVDGNC
ncbi:DsbA family oxidoreductase [Algoriphagus sp. H41]|uniref:DsbA family oxidoreductase n=1 Tax=Algoriphagus oliviformis TaxID=2811231 RepID=A0ABS3C4P8_9BACT|nr:DsbA family oxidoreductase [Algoriphagus oliviformis]MBN7812089.1 DsbA family oxidoreductase [Algoriphagus oliviformis]